MSCLKKSGIDFLGQINIGTHMCQFCKTFDENLELVPSFFEAGISENDLCVWIIPNFFSKEKAISFLKNRFSKEKNIIENDNVLIYYEEEAYFENSLFKPEKTSKLWDFILSKFSNSNFKCIRAVGSCMNLKHQDFEAFTKYEELMVNKILNLPILAICQYNDKYYDTFEIASITKNHKVCIAKTNGNWKALKNTEITAKEELIQSINHELECLKNDKNSSSDFLCNLSHDFKTPLNIILSTIQLIETKKAHSSQLSNPNKHLNIMRQNCHNILNLVENITDLNKFESGMLSPNFCSIDVVSLVEDICENFSNYIKINKLTLNLVKKIQSKIVYCDPQQIHRIFLNLLSNAVNYSLPDGTITITIDTINPKEDNTENMVEKIAISVKDTGIGISEDKLQTIFERYTRTSQNLTNPGTGLGLFVVNVLVQNHKGTIKVKSTIGRGSEFIVTLPINLQKLSKAQSTV